MDVVLAMGLYADEDERLLCMAVSPPDTGKPLRHTHMFAALRHTSI